MSTAVLIHGGFHGGWCWRKVSAALIREGWTVFAPSLTGLGERAHLASPSVRLTTHVQDVAKIIECEELDDIVLCGHSSGITVAACVADQMASRIQHLVYVDGPVPSNGESFLDAVGHAEGLGAIFRSQATTDGDGWLVPPQLFDANKLGIADPADVAYVNRRMTAHPLAAFDDKAERTGASEEIPRKSFARCERFPIQCNESTALAFENDPGWHVERWDAGHDAMITRPGIVCDILTR